jgi:ectoine hydroxylase-related dioxygenase (phytanoyl-CoA dioxygenase family)
MAETAALPLLDDRYAVPPEAADGYRRDGHVLLRGVASRDEVAAYRAVLSGIVAEYRKGVRPLEERDTYGRAFLQVGNLWRRDERIARFVLAKRFARIAADLMGVNRVRLYHDQALYKEAGGGITPWHQDQYYWPLDTANTITMWMPLVDLTPEMGIMRFASGSQRDGFIGKVAISDASEALFKRYVTDRGFALWQAEAMAAGDATFHSGWTLHSAPPNTTLRTREVMTIIWYADGARVVDPDTDGRKGDYAAFFSHLKPGALAEGPATPLVYDRAVDG